MTNITQQRAAALGALAQTGILRSNYLPLLTRLLWRLGFDVPPPHFESFWRNILILGSYFTVLASLLMWLLVWSHDSDTLWAAIAASAISGMLFGVVMAGYYAYGKRKYKLPDWRSLS